MKNKWLTLCFLVCTALLLTSCSTINGADSLPQVELDRAALPEGYTIDSFKSAIIEYVNYRMWTSPDHIYGTVSEKSFEPFVGQIIDVNIRVYVDDAEKKTVYAHTNEADWLIVLNQRADIVYGDGQVSEGETNWPQGKWESVAQFPISVEKARKPNYGSSPRKDKMIAAAEVQLKYYLCEDFVRGEGGEKWIGATAYLTDFFEYEEGASAWLIRGDGYAAYTPLAFVEGNNAFKAVGVKGFSLENIHSQDPGFTYEQQIKDTVLKFTCE
ncbi:hypothetical protein D3P07_24245 [Paenibacillus sp. 1011MAR3C5]|uniref:hypothetical protein n=1 Tax=Paenibacillus sp. 1011MAR3C5 TaxID=1675787 RepID=UPI000E6BE35E|nr:hypothetical protein [Paenibacillus sp. 1011MAR3C5]RJE83924.1 hypothetical protein D3P07_24245 [Paenibacillus sp. 1011MAR3C5]